MLADSNQYKRFSIFWTKLDPTVGGEMKKSRPAVIISNDEMNVHLTTVIIAPITSKMRPYPTRFDVDFKGNLNQVALDQVRTVDKSRLYEFIKVLDVQYQAPICDRLQELFQY